MLRHRFLKKLGKLQSRLKQRLLPDVIRNKGYCPICDRSATFYSKDAWLRDHYYCSQCKSIPRERALMAVIAERFPDWRQLRIHESSPVNRGVSRRLRKECHQYIASQYFLNHPPGEGIDGVRCENLENLTFEDSSIDLHITQDVFEHVLNPAAAFSEIARTLRRGGAHIFTVPLVNKERPTSLRAQLDDDGKVIHLKPPEYHRNPVDPQGSLVTIDWGFDIVDQIEKACGLKTEIVRLDDVSRGIRAEYIEVLITMKA